MSENRSQAYSEEHSFFDDHELNNKNNNELLSQIEQNKTIPDIDCLQFYSNTRSNKSLYFLNESLITSKETIDLILINYESAIFDKQIAGKLQTHQILKTFYLQELFMKYIFLEHDIPMSECQIDEEPENNSKDFWRAFDMPVEKKQIYIEQREEQEDLTSQFGKSNLNKSLRSKSHISMKSSDDQKRILQKGKQIIEANSNNNDQQIIEIVEPKYKIIDLTPQEEIDTYTETLRILKQRQEENQKEQIRTEQQRYQQMMEHQKQMKKLGDLRKQNGFTYDYDGSVIIMKQNPQQEQLQENQVEMQSKINNYEKPTLEEIKEDDQDSFELKNLKKKSGKKAPPKPLIRKAVIDQVSEVQVGWIPPNVFEKFSLGKGVKLMENGRKVTGPEYEADIDIKDNESITNQKISNPKQKIKMTKNQYQHWIKGADSDNDQSQFNDSEAAKNSFMSKNNQTLKFLSDQYKKKMSKPPFDPEKSYLDGGTISIHNLEKVQNSIDFSHINSSRGESFLSNNLVNISLKSQINQKQQPANHRYQKTVIDDYNLKIYNKKIDSQMQSQKHDLLPPLYSPKPHPLEISKSLGQLHKYPRSRLTQLAQNINNTNIKLPAPKVGNTVGHSILSGINPDDPETFEIILDKLANQSMESQQSNRNMFNQNWSQSQKNILNLKM